MLSCAGVNCRASKKKLTVYARKPAKGKFRLRYIHTDSADRVRHENDGGFDGTATWKQDFTLKSTLKAKRGKGSAPIRCTKANYLRKRVGEFASQAGGLGTPGACQGVVTSTLAATRNGTARVLWLSVTGRRISLDFTPGQVFSINGNPAENLRQISTFEALCQNGDDSNWNRMFLGYFGNLCSTRHQLQRTSDSLYFARLDRGWKVRPHRKKGFARLVGNTKLYGALLWKDTFILDRL